ncbi:hypothetical protein AOZ06_27130 [Kibdelosporangium phytohabitans]|uniref:Uncharacterized protein n=1 Tax=Kibdelosporangium phytohabitans TaxID=860235 RepID=A0A0N9I6L2_9PSEU|nr:hypothetical protein AOZ06_27130 [Kibdelosporangium phytohabitans]
MAGDPDKGIPDCRRPFASQPVVRSQADRIVVFVQERDQVLDRACGWWLLVDGSQGKNAQCLPQLASLQQVVLIWRPSRGQFAALQPLGEPAGRRQPLDRVRTECTALGGEQVQPHGATIKPEGKHVLLHHHHRSTVTLWPLQVLASL